MANPAPTINQINAFNATQGTTIDFNIIGGTELVRSNRIYIYDLSDNSLICTHLYVSTESIHELPANTDGSIVYESGKSSADFVNGAQYYAQIQTFTDIAGTEGGSGLSVAKMFWCLVDPTLTITTIPSTISTTSYNVSATYNANTSVVSNIIQQYQFSLYSATGSLLQSSGVVVGSGEQQGTSTAYDISYNFTGLSVGSSYYVTVEVTTTQGMSVTTQSNTFTVSIDTPTLGEATVVNNACDGYISVTSNLSSEYGGSGSGEIVSFETDSENVFTKLQVNLDPIQDLNGYDSPWVGGAGKNKFDASLIEQGSFDVPASTHNCITTHFPITSGQEYTWSQNNSTNGWYVRFYDSGYNEQDTSTRITKYNATQATFTAPQWASYMRMMWYSVTEITPTDIKALQPQVEKGSSATTWTPYSNICPISGWDEVGVSVVGKNLFDSITWATLGNNSSFYSVANDGKITVNANDGSGISTRLFTLKAGAHLKLVMSGFSDCRMFTSSSATLRYDNFIVPSDGKIAIKFRANSYPTTGWAMIVPYNETSPTTYEPYNGTSYTTTLPSTTYGGTLDLVSGVLVVTHKITTITSGMAWNTYTQGGAYIHRCIISDIKVSGHTRDYFSSHFYQPSDIWAQIKSGQMRNYAQNVYNLEFCLTPSTTSAQWSAYLDEQMANGTPVQLYHYLATPQTYQLTPQQIQTLVGVNNVWSEQGNVELSYHIPITNLLVKRQDVDDVSGSWLTLYSQPITQASDMDFTFIDFTNQYGKTYKYALVPLLTQTQSGVEVEVEGGYTVSDEVQSIFDGVFIVDSTGSQKCKANVGYGNVDMNQTVGTITPIGAKYPVVITNSQNQYHNGSISGTIVPDDYYFNGNLSRVDMVNKRDELEQFLTNKRAKIIKDWNGKIWLVMIMDNVSCTFNNNYGMGIVNFSTNWVEVGDPTNQEDLQATGLINVGGV